jgi:N-acetylmuramoyl-L-alanine amidase
MLFFDRFGNDFKLTSMRYRIPAVVCLTASLLLALSAFAVDKPRKSKRDYFRFAQRAELTTVTHLVLDPGHGGDNHGAVGYWGTREKALTLAIARYMRDYIETNSNVRVTLTRHDDRAIGLRSRPRLANKLTPNAFISLHCNATPKRDVSGMEVWFLSSDASREVIHDLVRREEGLPTAPHTVAAPWSVEAIVSEMAYSMAHQRSSDFAHALGSGLRWGRPSAKFRGIKQAAFGVLKEARMPAVVLEVGFISNPAEGKELLDPKTHLQLSRGVMRGLILLDRKQVASAPAWKKRRQLVKTSSRSLPGGPAASQRPPR